MLNAKELSLIITFGGLAIALNPTISGIGIPYPLLPGMIFQIWEIPTVAAFLLFGLKKGISVAGINSAFLLTIYPGMAQPWYWLGSFISVSSMMLGVYISHKIINHNYSEKIQKPSKLKILTASLALGVLFRVVFMAPVMLAILSVLTYPPLAVSRVATVVLPLQAVYNIIVPLYMIPTGYLIAKVVNRNLKVGNQII